MLGRGGIFDCLGWLLKFILKPVLRHVKAHVCNTPKLLEYFNKPSIAERKGKFPVSFDAVSLYTNIPVKETFYFLFLFLFFTRKHILNSYCMKEETDMTDYS